MIFLFNIARATLGRCFYVNIAYQAISDMWNSNYISAFVLQLRKTVKKLD